MSYCPNCGDEIAVDAIACPTCDVNLGGVLHAVAEPPPNRDLQRIADLRAATDRRRQERERKAQAAVGEPVLSQPRRSPIFGILSLLLPVALPLAPIALFLGGGLRQSGGVFPAFIALAVILLVVGSILGLIAVAIAYLRRERWLPLQICGVLLNASGLLIILSIYMRSR